MATAVDVLKIVCRPRNQRVVEYGCGSGRTGRWLAAQKPAEYTAFDGSEDMVGLARQRGLTNVWVHNVLNPWPRELCGADLVVGCQVLSHIHEDALEMFFANAARALAVPPPPAVAKSSSSRAAEAGERSPSRLLCIERCPNPDDYHISHSAAVLARRAASAGGLAPASVVFTGDTFYAVEFLRAVGA